MKRFISLLLCVVMCMSIFTATAGQVMAAGNASNIFTVTNTEFANNEITYTIKVAPNQTKIAGVVINVCFDSNLLEVVKGGAAGSYNSDGDFVPVVSGMYESGLKANSTNEYAIAFMNLNGVNIGSSAKDMFTVTFRGKSQNRPLVNVDFKCVEYITDDNNADNDIKKSDSVQTFASHSFHTLAMPVVTEVNSYGDGIRVVWTASEGAESYKLYRKAAGASGWTLVNDSITTNEYVDNSISKGTEYYYTVSASNSFGDTQYDNAGLSGMNFGSIDSISAVLNGTSAVINWSTLAGAEKYEVYRKASTSAEWQKLATVTSATYTDNSLSSGIEYSYKVRAIKGSYTADISCAPATVKYLAAPVATASNVNDGIEISFPAVGGAEKYIIERKTANGDFAVIAEIDGEEESYLDENVVAGTQYTYRLQSVASDMTSEKAVTASVTRLGTPVLKAIVNKANGLEISWNAVNGATSYVVYRKAVGESVMTVCARVSATTYLDTNVVSGEGYVYIVSAVNASGEGGYDSNGLSSVYLATPSLKQVASQGEDIVFTWNAVLGAESYNVYRVEAGKTNWTKVANVAELSYTDVKPARGVAYKYTVSAVKGAYESLYNTTGLEGMNFGSVDSISAAAIENGAKITWSSVPSATTYEVYRKLASSSDWQKVATVTKTEYTDTSISSGVTYNYKVKAINGKYVAEMSCDAATVKFLAMPVIGSVVITNGAVKLEWNAIQGADSYNIYRVEADKTNWVKIGNTETRNFSDTTAALNVNYKYTISAVSGDIESKYGINCKDAVNFGTITTITATPVSGGAKISWNALSKATSYELYRKAGSGAWAKLATVTTTSYTDTTLQSGVLYQYMVKAYCGSLLSEMTAAPAQAKILAVPTAVAKNVANGIQLTITPVNGAEGYRIEKEVNGAYVVIKTLGANETVFVDTEVQSEKTYKYKVYATSSVTTSFACEVAPILRLSHPKITSASNLVPGITMTWTAIDGAVSYTVLRKAPGETEWKTIKTGVKTNTYTDGTVDNGVVYTYTIKAVMEGGEETGFDPVGRSVTFVETPDLESVSSAVNGVLVKWSSIEGATSYRVYRRGAGSTYWYYLGDVKGTSFTDTTKEIKSGEYYRYTVRAVNNYYSGFDTNGLYLKYVASPKLTGISNSTNGLYIKWNAVAGVTNGYRVYRRGAGSTYWTYLGTVKTTYYTDTAVKNYSGNYYRYTVIADASTSTKYKTHSAFDTTGLYLLRLSDPVLSAAKSYSSGISVSWKAVAGAKGYNVYRKTASSGWTCIGKSTTTSYVDKTAKKGTTYTYTVRAYSGSTLSSYNTKGISCKDLY